MKTKVYTYGGFLIIESSPNAEGLLAYPGQPDTQNIGCVVDATKTLFTKNAIKALKTVPKGTDGIGDFDAFEANKPIFSWLGGPIRIYDISQLKEYVGSRDYNPKLLTATEEDIQPSEQILTIFEEVGIQV